MVENACLNLTWLGQSKTWSVGTLALQSMVLALSFDRPQGHKTLPVAFLDRCSIIPLGTPNPWSGQQICSCET